MSRVASACKASKLAQARQALSIPASSAAALESATDFLRRVARIDAAQCPTCKIGRLRVVQTLAQQRRLPAPLAAAPRASCGRHAETKRAARANHTRVKV